MALHTLFAAPMMTEMETAIEASHGMKVGEAGFEGMLAELASLFEDEARCVFAEKSKKSNRRGRRD